MSNYSPGDAEKVRESGKTLKIFPGNVFDKAAGAKKHKNLRNKEVNALLKKLWTDRRQPPPYHLFRKDNPYSKSAIYVAKTVWNQYKTDRDLGKGKRLRSDPDFYGEDKDQVYIVSQDKGAQFEYDGNDIKYNSTGKWVSLRDSKTKKLVPLADFNRANEHLYYPSKFEKENAIKNKLNQPPVNNQLNIEKRPANLSGVKVKDGDLVSMNSPVYPSDASERYPGKTVVNTADLESAATTPWRRGQGDLKTRNEQTLAYWDSKYEGIGKTRDNDLARALRTGEAWETGKGTIIYQPERGAMQVFKQREPQVPASTGSTEPTIKDGTLIAEA